MSELEEKLGAILNNPQMMQQIMSMAQVMSTQASPQNPEPPSNANSVSTSTPSNLDPRMLESLAKIAMQGNVDQNQITLLHALSPYLSHNKISKLERAMHASRMAGAASAFLNAGGLQMLTGR